MSEKLTTNTYYHLDLTPKFGPCYDFEKEALKSRRSIWLVPHVIKHREDSDVITWRCNLGQACESDCLYAMAKEKTYPLLNSFTVKA